MEECTMKKVLALGMLGLMIAAAFALGTSATFRDYRAQRSVHIAVVPDDSELIDLTPVQPYAYLNDGGQLVIDFSADNPNWPGWDDESWWKWDEEQNMSVPARGMGLSPQSRYNFDEVFNVSNHLWEQETIVVRITSSDPGMVSFYEPNGMMYNTNGGGQPYNSDTAVGDVCFYLEPGEALGVGMELAAANTLGSYDINITIQAWPASEAPIECGGG
ncbi:DUF1102 domain-containing protein [Thermococcus thioreducens]|nr:DUF1102 domain-containing protein [Thermococcus thioreducens]